MTAVEDDLNFTVVQLNGHPMEVMSVEEAAFYSDQQRRYTAENHFSAVSDLTDLDRLISYELQTFRMNRWLASGRDYDGRELPISAHTEMRRQMKELATLISGVKVDLGLTRSAREAEQAESVGSYLTELKRRAKEHGIKREGQLTRALVLVAELKSLVGTFDRANESERRRIGLESEADIVEWIRLKLIPEFDEVDAHFRANSQKFWVGSL